MKGAIIPIFMLLITTCFTTKMVSCEPEVPCDFGSGDNNNWSGLKSTVSLSDGRRTGDRYTANNDEDIVSFSTTLWKKFQGDAIFSLYTPFVLSLAAGNLPEDSFENYKTQDSYYLIAYYKAYKITTIYTDVDEKIKEKCERSAKKYNSTAVIPEGLPHATQNYMNFLINTASGTVEELENVSVQQPKIPAFTLTAMTPCNRLYACLGKKLKEVVVSLLENPYKDWIEENASNHTQQSTRATEGLVDGASVKMAPEERDVVEKLYKHGMKHEFEFFQSQLPKDQNAVIVPLSQKLKHDNRKLMISVDANAILAGDTYVSSGYESLFQTQVLKYAGDFSLNKKGGKLTEDLLQTAKKSMEDIKNKVVESIGEVILQPYGLNFFEKVLLNKEENISIYVIPSGDKEGTNVQANQLNNYDDKNLTAFIGSSVDNWSQLCNAKIGIVIGLNSELKKKGDDNGISFVPLFNGLVDIQSKYHAGSTPLPWKPNVLYTISSWAEIDAFILGYY